jgi:hypothetical protein
LSHHLRHLRSPETIEKPEPLSRPRKPAMPVWWAFVLLVPAATIGGLLIWGAVYVWGPKRDSNLPPEPKGQGPQAQAPQGPAPGPAPPRAVPPIEGDEFFQKVWADLHDGNYWKRKAAVERLATMKPNDQRAKVAPRLAELMADESPFIRWPAIKALGAWGSETDVPALMRVLADNDSSNRREALKVIGRFRDRRTLEPVIQSFREHSTNADAAQALRAMGPMAEPDVLAILNEPEDLRLVFVKLSAIEVLADIGTEKSVPALQNVTASRNIHERRLIEPAQKALAAIAQRKKQ